MLPTMLNMGFFVTKGHITPVNGPIQPKFELVYAVQVICKFHKVSIKTKQATLQTE